MAVHVCICTYLNNINICIISLAVYIQYIHVFTINYLFSPLQMVFCFFSWRPYYLGMSIKKFNTAEAMEDLLHICVRPHIFCCYHHIINYKQNWNRVNKFPWKQKSMTDECHGWFTCHHVQLMNRILLFFLIRTLVMQLLCNILVSSGIIYTFKAKNTI